MTRIRARSFQFISKRLLSDSNNKDTIMGLYKKADGSNRITSDEQDASFVVLSLLQKNNDNTRFNIRHIRNSCMYQKPEANMDEEVNNLKAPQYLKLPTTSSDAHRCKTNQMQRLNKAVVNTCKYKMGKLSIVDQDIGKNMLTRNTGSQLASEIEDKIQLSIMKGDFDNLKNAGKPLPVKFENPLVDRTTDLAFDILKKNGIIPIWIDLQKMIYSLKEDLRSRLKIEWCKRIQALNVHLNNDNHTIPHIIMPSSDDIANFDREMARAFAEDEFIINKKIDEYNIIGNSYH